MFIKRKEYEELEKYKDKCEELEYQVKILNVKLEERKSKEYVCDALCQGCQNLIESTMMDFSGYSVSERSIKNCALNRNCKGYKAKE